MMYLFATVPHQHGHWQLQGNRYATDIGNCVVRLMGIINLLRNGVNHGHHITEYHRVIVERAHTGSIWTYSWAYRYIHSVRYLE